MANGSGLAITGVIIGVIVATQVGDFESADIDLPDVSVERDGDPDSSSDDDSDSRRDGDSDSGRDDDSRPRAVPTQVDAGSNAVQMAGAVTSVDGGAGLVPGVPAEFCVTGVTPPCCTSIAATGSLWRWTC